MKEYLLLLRGGKPMEEKTQEESNEEMRAWGVYMGKLAADGSIVDGLPLVSGGKTVASTVVIDHPVTSAKEGTVGGYLVIKAANIEAAAGIAKDCPHISNKGNIEVREIAPMPVM